MVNPIILNQPTVFNGLGTLSYTVSTTGNYVFKFQSTLPFIAAGDPPFTSGLAQESTNVTVVADVSGSLNSTYWTFNSAGDLRQYYVWYNINGAGVDPAPAGKTGIQVTGATNVSALNVGVATRTAIAASSAATDVIVTGATTHVILTNRQQGQSTDAANGTASPGFSYSITQGSFGVPPESALDVVVKNGATVLAQFGNPTPTQEMLMGSLVIQATAADVITVVLSSLSQADNYLNVVKTQLSIQQGLLK